MGLGHKLVLLAMAAGLLRAADSPDLVYHFRLPVRASRIEWTSAPRGDWNITVRVDTTNCEVSCEYRAKGHTSGRLLAPPVVVMRVFADAVSVPLRVTVDPAGSELPVATAKERPPSDLPYLPGRKIFALVILQPREPAAPDSRTLPAGVITCAAGVPSLFTPLRI